MGTKSRNYLIKRLRESPTTDCQVCCKLRAPDWSMVCIMSEVRLYLMPCNTPSWSLTLAQFSRSFDKYQALH